jgi:hypothetical protein
MKRAPKILLENIVVRFIIELVIYAFLISVYLVVILHFLVGWLTDLFRQQPVVYAFASIILMIMQAVGLERVTGLLVNANRRPRG